MGGTQSEIIASAVTGAVVGGTLGFAGAAGVSAGGLAWLGGGLGATGSLLQQMQSIGDPGYNGINWGSVIGSSLGTAAGAFIGAPTEGGAAGEALEAGASNFLGGLLADGFKEFATAGPFSFWDPLLGKIYERRMGPSCPAEHKGAN